MPHATREGSRIRRRYVDAIAARARIVTRFACARGTFCRIVSQRERTRTQRAIFTSVVTTLVATGIIAAGPSHCQSVHGAVQHSAIPYPAVAVELPDSVETPAATLLAYRAAGGAAFCPGFRDYKIRDHLGIFSVRWTRAATCGVDVGYTYLTPANIDSHDTQRFEASQDSLARIVAELIGGTTAISESRAVRQSFNTADQIQGWCAHGESAK